MLAGSLAGAPASAGQADSNYLLWTVKQAEQMSASTRRTGRIGAGRFRATWLTPEVMRGVARLVQVAQMINVEETDSLVQNAEAAGDTIVRLEFDARMMATLPDHWTASLQPKVASAGSRAAADRGVLGKSVPDLAELPVLKAPIADGFTAFWLVFPLHTAEGAPVFGPGIETAEFVIRVGDRTAVVSWTVPSSLRTP